MPKHTKIEEEIQRLRTLSPDRLSPYTVRLPPGLALEAAHFARQHNYQMARGLIEIFESYLRATKEGVVFEFQPDLRRQLDVIATAMGTTRDAVVQRIVAENIIRYLQQAVALQHERNEIERVFAETQRDTETPAAPVKPAKSKK